jgi:hypothetical protein
MYNYEEQLANLCDTRKAIINGLSAQGLDPQQIYDLLQTPYTNNVCEYIEDATAHYDAVAKCMRQLEDMGIAPDDATTQVYYFDWEEGVCEETVQMLTLYSTPYQGQQLVDDVKDIIPVILQPLMDEAIAEQNASAINQLAEAMTYVIGMLIKQEQPNG